MDTIQQSDSYLEFNGHLSMIVRLIGAIAVSTLVIFAPLFGLSQRIRFDAASRVVTYGFTTALTRYRERHYPFGDIETLRVKTHH